MLQVARFAMAIVLAALAALLAPSTGATQPTPTFDVDSAAHHPLRLERTFPAQCLHGQSQCTISFGKVAANTRAVIGEVSCFLTLYPGATYIFGELAPGNLNTDPAVYLVGTSSPGTVFGQNVVLVAQAVTMIFDPSEEIQVIFYVNPSNTPQSYGGGACTIVGAQVPIKE